MLNAATQLGLEGPFLEGAHQGPSKAAAETCCGLNVPVFASLN